MAVSTEAKPNTWIKNDTIYVDYHGHQWATRLFPIAGTGDKVAMPVMVEISPSAAPITDAIHNEQDKREPVSKILTIPTDQPKHITHKRFKIKTPNNRNGEREQLILKHPPIKTHKRGRPPKTGKVSRTTLWRRKNGSLQ